MATTTTDRATTSYNVAPGASASAVNRPLPVDEIAEAREFLDRAVKRADLTLAIVRAETEAIRRVGQDEPYEGGVDREEFRERYGV